MPNGGKRTQTAHTHLFLHQPLDILFGVLNNLLHLQVCHRLVESVLIWRYTLYIEVFVRCCYAIASHHHIVVVVVVNHHSVGGVAIDDIGKGLWDLKG